MDGTIKVIAVGNTFFWELDLLPPISPLVPQDVDAAGNYDDRIPIVYMKPVREDFTASATVVRRKRAA